MFAWSLFTAFVIFSFGKQTKKKNKLNETQTISTLFSATLKLKVTSVSPSPGQLTFDWKSS